MAPQQFALLLRGEFAIIGKPLVMTTSDEVEEIRLEVGSSTGNCVDFILPNHFRERNTEFGSTHSASQRNHHFPTSSKMCAVGVGSIFEHCRVEVTVMPIRSEERRVGKEC